MLARRRFTSSRKMQHHLIRLGRTYRRRASGRDETRRVIQISRLVGVPLQDGKVRSTGELTRIAWVDQDGQRGETSLCTFAVWAQTDVTPPPAEKKGKR